MTHQSFLSAGKRNAHFIFFEWNTIKLNWLLFDRCDGAVLAGGCGDGTLAVWSVPRVPLYTEAGRETSGVPDFLKLFLN